MTAGSVFERIDARAALRDPGDGSPARELTAEHVRFAGGRSYPCLDGRPVLIDEATSLFSIRDVLARRPTTQNGAYRDRRRLKNFVRQRVLPGMTWNPDRERRCDALAAEVADEPILVLGAGDRIDEYRRRFRGAPLVTSDVHLQFGADCAIDAHRIPFKDGFFGLVIADQVLEHTTRPWVVAEEMQRVTRRGGLIHVEVPFSFPYHGAPYDFFRFTPSALRFLFARSEVVALDITEGRFSAAAVYLASGMVDSFAARPLRQLALAGSRLALWWLKYLDAAPSGAARLTSPKGLYVTLRVDGVARDEARMLRDVGELLNRT